MSTRTLVRWAGLSLTFKGAPKVFEYALTQALTARAEPEQREAIHRIAADVFGDYCGRRRSHDREVLRLFRFTHPDGTAKEWAIADWRPVPRLEVRWGKAGQLVQNQTRPDLRDRP